jgi:hypothetical protein
MARLPGQSQGAVVHWRCPLANELETKRVLRAIRVVFRLPEAPIFGLAPGLVCVKLSRACAHQGGISNRGVTDSA